MPLNVSRKLIESHLIVGEIKASQEIGLKSDQTLTQDATRKLKAAVSEYNGEDESPQVNIGFSYGIPCSDDALVAMFGAEFQNLSQNSYREEQDSIGTVQYSSNRRILLLLPFRPVIVRGMPEKHIRRLHQCLG